MRDIRIRSGIDLRFAGAPDQTIEAGSHVASAALLGSDFPGLRPALAVAAGDKVRAGQLLFSDRRQPEIAHVAPVSGTIVELSRGRRRSLDTLVIAVDAQEGETFPSPASPDRQSLTTLLLRSGQWLSLRTRPFGRIPAPGAVPAAIFITAIDTAPLSPDPAVVIAAYADRFARGAEALRLLTDGKVHLAQARGAVLPVPSGVEASAFSGPHPAGLAGTHIHHLHPVGPGVTVWQISYQDVIAIGHLLETGRIWSERVVALAGPGMVKPGLVLTRPGASLRELCAGRLEPGGVRLLSGSPLDGRQEHFLSRWHCQVSAMPHHPPAEARGGPLRRLHSFLRRDVPAVIPNAAHEQAAPARILPVPFLRALGIGDAQTALRLGALELLEEDMALLSHLDGVDYGDLLRRVLDELEAQQ
ncbi:NADH:ubiquinone reductase (Na(+)-transporting) subunit A [Aureimonas populi]|uniref:Na(+)-translocating NADH-quinone reductase subunit A n=1 Tax=Aureimonas populi TaxID=1701758 RepID=A0ABW5CQZ4_9HYPH|nr:hypothetical protein [Aureimonas populi]